MLCRTYGGRGRERGITLIELLIVLAAVGLLMAVMTFAFNRWNKTDLRDDTLSVAASLRATFNMATFSGTHHRVVFDLDNQTFRIEACPGNPRLYRTDIEAVVPDPNKLEELVEKVREKAQQQTSTANVLPQVQNAESPEKALEAMAAIENIDVSTASCQPPTTPTGTADGRGVVRKIESKRVRLKAIYVTHLDEPVTKGTVSINFFALGSAEKAVIELGDEYDNTFFLLVHRLTGVVELKKGGFDPDDHMRRDGAGDDEDDDDRGGN